MRGSVPRGEVPYARVECNFPSHPILARYPIGARYLYLCLNCYCVQMRHDIVPNSQHFCNHLAAVLQQDRRTLATNWRKLVQGGDLLQDMGDGTVLVVGVRLKNAKIKWKDGPLLPRMGTYGSLARAIPLPLPIPIPPPSSPPASFLEEYSEREKEIAQAAFMVVWGNVPAMSDDHKPVFVWAKLAAPKITGDPLAFLRNRYDYHHFKSPATLLEGVVNDWKIPPAEKIDGQRTAADIQAMLEKGT